MTAAPDPFRLTVVVPVFNEERLVAESLRRVLALPLEDIPHISALDVVAVDDASTDRSASVLANVSSRDPRIRVTRHATNRGKGAAIRTGLQHATGDITMVHDADLEYDPRDIPALLRPFVDDDADAVFGSRFLAGDRRRALRWGHTLVNRSITLASNLVTDLALTDVETCYKAVRTDLFRALELQSDDYRIEIEIAARLAHRRARIFEVPIRYEPRTFLEGKKIRPRDGALALAAILRFGVLRR